MRAVAYLTAGVVIEHQRLIVDLLLLSFGSRVVRLGTAFVPLFVLKFVQIISIVHQYVVCIREIAY